MHSEFMTGAMLTTMLGLAGCGLMDRTTVDSPAAAQFPTADDSLDFWDALETQAVTTNDDAVHGFFCSQRCLQEIHGQQDGRPRSSKGGYRLIRRPSPPMNRLKWALLRSACATYWMCGVVYQCSSLGRLRDIAPENWFTWGSYPA